MKHQRSSRTVSAGMAVLVATALAGCGGGGDTGGGGSGGTITLTVSTFSTFGYEGELERQYERANPDVDVVFRKQEMNNHHEQLAQHLAAGSGTADVEAIEAGFINEFKAQPENFHNLLEFGAGQIKGRWLDWKWQQSMAPQGDYQVGLGTDIGGLAMCYRTDLFEEAGLPTDRDEVSDLWSTWQDYIDVGKTFEASGADAQWVDSGTNIFNPVLRQQDQGFFNRQHDLLMGNSSGARTAWDTTMDVIQSDLSAGLTTFQPEWSTGFQKSAFATVICPAWMMANIKEYAAQHEGQWDIADVPGGGGNWGGSFLTIPQGTDHPREAYELAKWLTAPEQQLHIFKDIGNLPSTPGLYDDPALANYSDSFFNDAPVGEIFTGAAREFEPQYQGPKTGQVREAVENVIRQVADDKLSPQQGWEQAVQAAQREVS